MYQKPTEIEIHFQYALTDFSIIRYLTATKHNKMFNRLLYDDVFYLDQHLFKIYKIVTNQMKLMKINYYY